MPAPNRKIDAGYVTMEFSPPLESIAQDLRVIGRDLSNMRTPLTTSIKQVVIPSIDANFEAGGRPPWTPLSDETVEKRTRLGTGLKILQVTGQLRRTATQFSRWDVNMESASIGNWPANVLTKAAVHQFGAEATGRTHTANIPARPFLMLQDSDEVKIVDIFLDWMELRARGRWKRA